MLLEDGYAKPGRMSWDEATRRLGEARIVLQALRTFPVSRQCINFGFSSPKLPLSYLLIYLVPQRYHCAAISAAAAAPTAAVTAITASSRRRHR